MRETETITMYTIVRFAVCIILFGAGHTLALNGVPTGF